MKKFWMDEDGLTTVEYALLLALIVAGRRRRLDHSGRRGQ